MQHKETCGFVLVVFTGDRAFVWNFEMLSKQNMALKYIRVEFLTYS